MVMSLISLPEIDRKSRDAIAEIYSKELQHASTSQSPLFKSSTFKMLQSQTRFHPLRPTPSTPHPIAVQLPIRLPSALSALRLIQTSSDTGHWTLAVSTITSLYSLDSCLFPSTAHFCIPCDTHLQLCHLPPSLPHITFRSNHQTHSLPQSTYSICTLILPDLPPLRHHLLAPIPPQPDHQPSLYPLPNQPQSPKTSL